MHYAELGAKELIDKNRAINLITLIMKPMFKFFECYILKLGILDGLNGLIIAANAAHSLFMKYAIALQSKRELKKP